MFKLLFLTFAFLSLSFSLSAKPWLDTGDVRLRHHLQVLSDAGYLKAPLTTWPLSSEDIDAQLRQAIAREILKPAVKASLAYVNSRIKQSSTYSSFKVGADVRTKTLLIRDFSGKGREKASTYIDGSWGNSIIDARLKFSAAKQAHTTLYLFSDPDDLNDNGFQTIIHEKEDAIHPDNSIARLDESYLSSELGNWKITARKQSRWWGPSWDGSLILSNNARPIPSLSLENINSEAFESKFFNWIGPNKFHMFVGILESTREVSKPKFFGFRYNFKPTLFKNFEVGLSRTLMWGGGDQDESVSDLFKTLFGVNSNVTGDRISGNTLASIDMRWKLPLDTDNHYTLYGQYLVEDTGNSVVGGDDTLQLGGSMSGYSTSLDGSWRTYLEIADTSSGLFAGDDRNNTTYNHDEYLNGYRHLGMSMGHGIDSDSTLISFGSILATNNGDLWRGWLKTAELDLLKTRDGLNPISGTDGRKWTAVGVNYETNLGQKTRVNAGAHIISDNPTNKERKTSVAVDAGFSYLF